MDFLTICNHIRGSRYIGVSALMNGVITEFCGCEIIKKKNEFEVYKSFQCNQGVKDIKNHVSGEFPLVLNIEGKGVIHKVVENINLNDKDIGKSLFPGVVLEEFFIQIHQNKNGTGYISICRKELIMNLIEEFKQYGFLVIALKLGPFSIESFLPDIDFDNNELPLFGIMATIRDGMVDCISKNTKMLNCDVKFQEEIVNSDTLTSYCTVLDYFVNKNSGFIKSGILRQLTKENVYRKRFLSLLYLVPLLIFLGLLINFILYSHYNKDLEKTEKSYSLNSSVLGMLKKMEGELSDKENFIKGNEITGTKADIRYFDLLAKSLPDGIILNKMEINPLQTKIKESQQVKLMENKIIIEGDVIEESVLRDWIGELNEEMWTKQVKIRKFVHEEHSALQFELLITIKE